MSFSNWAAFNMSLNGPFDLKKTLETGHSSFPLPRCDKFGRYYIIITLPNTKKSVLIRFYQKGAKVTVEFSAGNDSINENELDYLKKLMRKVLGLNLDILEFYDIFKRDPIAPTFISCNGIRLTGAYDLFESLISSILTQNNTIWKWIGQARKIQELMGEKIPTEHFMVYSFPSAQILFRNKHLLKEAKLGYREQYIIETAEDIANYQIRLERLIDQPTLEAKKTLMKLKGIGSKVADMFLLYGLGKVDTPPTDIWIQRGLSKIFFKGAEKSIDECREKLVEHYGKWAGLAQLYIYNWIRNYG